MDDKISGRVFIFTNRYSIKKNLDFQNSFMFKRLKKLKYKNISVIKSFGYLSILQFLNLLLPLITYPYLIRILGKENYGTYVYAVSIVSYLVIILNFGFNISATKEISVNKSNKERIDEIVSSVFIIKSVLFGLVFLILFLLIKFVPSLNHLSILLLLVMHTCVYELLFPFWFFQGIEKMGYITLVNFISRSISVILIFLLINEEGQILRVPIVNSLGTFGAVITSIALLKFKFKIRFYLPSKSILYNYFKESAIYFLSNVSTQIYTNSTRFITGSFFGMTSLAYYDLAEKIVRLLRLPIRVGNQAIFPSIVKDPGINRIKHFILAFIIIETFALLAILLFGEDIVLLIAGAHMIYAVKYVQILSFIVYPIIVSTFLGMLLIAQNRKKEYVQILFYGLMFYLISLLIIILLDKFEILSLILCNILVEIFILILIIKHLKKEKNDLNYNSGI